ncbi:hypothetical protein GYO_0706 [Bacillus spizizenii TU-B-10]|uniref:Uncharacterized protein n=1 Tax=Bacillus spizizenii (strain DSM 15029 / JCM 12233 / NBRC 101239 / NRRL B-23049 / TU-B-10) TaxID=1052585 RepID=G4NW65_BACS4|nr:hypothetical protein GYO_0706 [Bacillus spizizenii TU-B-10]
MTLNVEMPDLVVEKIRCEKADHPQKDSRLFLHENTKRKFFKILSLSKKLFCGTIHVRSE